MCVRVSVCLCLYMRMCLRSPARIRLYGYVREYVCVCVCLYVSLCAHTMPYKQRLRYRYIQSHRHRHSQKHIHTRTHSHVLQTFGTRETLKRLLIPYWCVEQISLCVVFRSSSCAIFGSCVMFGSCPMFCRLCDVQ